MRAEEIFPSAGSDGVLSRILEPQGDENTFRQNWVRLIQKNVLFV